MISRDNIEAIYPLMQKQRALAYYSLQSSPHDPGFIQMRFLIRGPLDQDVFSQAWQDLLGRHESMRASLQSPKNKPSMLVILKNCLMQVDWVDLRHSSPADQQHFIGTRLDHIRERGLNLTQAPVHRLLGVRTADEVVEFYWACHHLFLDGWSAVVLLNDLAQLYSNKRSGALLSAPSVSNHADYLQWRSACSSEAASRFWSEQLAAYEEPVLFGSHFGNKQQSASGSTNNYQELVLSAGTELGVAIDSLATELKVTSATILYTAWAIYLGVVVDADDVVFGTTTAGRSFDLPDNQIMTGYYANVIPRRYQFEKDKSLASTILESHQNNFSALPFEYLSVDEIQSCAGIAINKTLFDNLVLFENLPQSDIVMQDPSGEVSIGTFSGGLTSTYPLTLTIRPDNQWRFKFLYSEQLHDANLHRTLELFPAYLLTACTESQETIAFHTERLKAKLHPHLPRQRIVKEPKIDSNASTQVARNSTELAVSAIWQKVLGLNEIDVHAEFIALGGRSIAAVRMLAEIEDALGKKLTMVEFVRQPTVAAIAKLIDGHESEDHWRCLIPLKTTGSRPPVTFIHAVGTHALFMRSITRYFHADQPVLGLQLVGLDGECEPLQSIESIAALYIKELQSYQPTGPYYFVSHCFGAVVGYEMINQLKEQGEEIALFVVLDAVPPLLKKRSSSGQEYTALVREVFGPASLTACKKLGTRIVQSGQYRTSLVWKKLYEHYVLRFGPTFKRKKIFMQAVHNAVFLAYCAYFGKPIDQKIVLISCGSKPNPLHLEWQGIASEFNVIRLPIGHETMFTEPEVAILGEQLNSLLSQAASPTN